jgi:hypothetical protein
VQTRWSIRIKSAGLLRWAQSKSQNFCCGARVCLWHLAGHADDSQRCPLLGVKQTLHEAGSMSAFDPKRTFPNSSLTTSGLPIDPRTQVATSRCINLHVIDVP